MRILFADAIDDTGPAQLRAGGHLCTIEPGLGADDLPTAIGDHEVLVVRSTTVSADTIGAADHLALIVRAGAGTDNIDRDAASARGIFVCNVPGRNAIAVAELTLGLLLAIDRRIPDNVADLRAGRWDKREYARSDGLYGKRFGIVGLGEIGVAVAERARAFGLDLVAIRRSSRSPEVEAAIESLEIELVESLDDLVAGCDVVSLHVPRAPDTVGLIDAERLARFRPGAILLNTARGDVIDHRALLAALDGGDLRAGLDVWPDEPGAATGSLDSALARHPRVVGTHHIGASTDQAQRSVSRGAAEVIESFRTGSPTNCVNLRREPSGSCCLTIRHLDRVGVLAEVFDRLRRAGINVQQMRNQLFEGGGAAVATINVTPDPDRELIDALRAIDEVIDVDIVDPTPT